MIATILILAAVNTVKITADRMAVDNVTKAAVATGNVCVVDGKVTVRSQRMERDNDGVMHFDSSTCATTCSNAVGHTHWNVNGEVKFKQDDYVLLRNAWLTFYEVPIMYLPYLYYPLDTKCGFSWMPGYQKKWGGFLLTRYRYNIIGDTSHQDNTWWMKGATRMDLRTRRGAALGEDLDWNLGDFGHGFFKMYYALDEDHNASHSYSGHYNSGNWGSLIDRERYAMTFKHDWEVAERDRMWVQGSYYSDSYVRQDFFKKSFFNSKSQWLGYEANGVYWEHLENNYALGAEVNGCLNNFYSQTERLPEFYFDVNPQPIFNLPLNYETQNRFGYLRRRAATYGHGDLENVFSHQPGIWADYESARLDTYHRITAPFRTFNDVMSVVPRLAYRGTVWNHVGHQNLTGETGAGSSGEAFRSIAEGGVTFAARGMAQLDEQWQHVAEPYLDVLAQDASYTGLNGSNRPYIFDSIDASVNWEDQFAGRSRNLPYSYYGITPGWRNAWKRMDERGNFRDYLDLDMYCAAQFNTTEMYGVGRSHELARVGDPNYGEDNPIFLPGARLRWMPTSRTSFGLHGEYDSERNRIAFGTARLSHKLSDTFRFKIAYDLRDYRYWDFSSSPYDSEQVREDARDLIKMHYIDIGFEHKLCDWLQWGPSIRWDIQENELDTVGAWIDYLTDCLGFRLLLEYENDYTTIDNYHRGDDFSVGFYIYLRAFGDGGGIFNAQ